MTFLETERLILRNVNAEDADIMYDYRNNEICSRFQRGQTKDFEGIVSLVQNRKNDVISTDTSFLLAVALKATNIIVGEVVVMPNEGTISLGYTFSYKYHRQGFAFEALSALIDLLHHQFPEWDFVCFTDPRNVASMGLLRKLGYQDMGYLPSRDSRVFGLCLTVETAAEFEQILITAD